MSEHSHDDLNARDKPEPYLKYATEYHAPVLCNAVVEGLITDPNGIYVDTTLGGGGHAAALLSALGPGAVVIGIDQDEEALHQARTRLRADMESGRLRPVAGNFSELEALITGQTDRKVDGILFDLGVSSHQLDSARRGFSHRFDGPLDMRMNMDSAVSAEIIVNSWSLSELIHVFRAYGEEPRAVSIARAIERQRPVETTSKLAEIIRKQVHPPHESKTLARVFQAIRIAVNDELDVLETALNGAATMLRTGGRLVAISYHSLEDRRVKRFLRSGNFEGRIERDLYGNRSVPFRELTRKPVSASPEEQQDNPRARSARLRIGERIREPLDLQRSSDT